MSGDLISGLVVRLARVCNELKIPYVMVGGIVVLAFGRTRTTSDIDIIIDHRVINFDTFVSKLQESGFDANKNDMKNFEDQMHVNFFDKKTMFRIDMKGVYSEKDGISITESQELLLDDVIVKIDSLENLLVNKLLFGSQIDLEDAIAVLARNYDAIDFKKLEDKAIKLGVEEDLSDLLKTYKENDEK